MDLRLATSCLLAIVAACSPGKKEPTPAVANAHEEKSSAGDGREEPTAIENSSAGHGREEPTAIEMLRPDAETLCDAFDRAVVAKAMGWHGLERISNEICSSDRQVCSCNFMAKDHPDGAGFGVMFLRTMEFMGSHLDAPYVPRDPIAGHEAVVAKHANGNFVSIQVRARGITIETNANDAGPPDAVEARLADATVKLLETLATDPAAARRN